MSADQEPAAGKGFIYILSNESMPGLLKVGLTENSVRQRIRELSGSTGVPTEFKVEKFFEIDASCLLQVEQTIHRDLKDSGFHHQKEFFRLSITQCTNVAEEVILRVTGIRSPDLVGLAERRLKAKAAREKWEAEELARRQSLVREANLKIAEQRKEWLSTQENPSDFISAWVYPIMFGACAVGAIVFTSGEIWLEIVILGLIVGWIFIKGKEDTAKQKRILDAEADRLFPFRSLEDFDRREYDEEKRREAIRVSKEEERKLQHRIEKYRTDIGVQEKNEVSQQNGKSWRLYRKQKLLVHVETNTEFKEGAYWLERATTTTGYRGQVYRTNDHRFPSAWEYEVEELP